MAGLHERAVEIKHTGTARVLIAYLEHKLEGYNKILATAKDEVSLRHMQGRAQEVTDLITFLTES